MERVSSIHGDRPYVIVAPHGPDDPNTEIIAETIATDFKCSAVINRGWEKSSRVDWFKDKANCNNISHCEQDVIREEFFEPVKSHINRALQAHGWAFMFLIHGIGDDVKKQSVNKDLQMILGCGSKGSRSCSKEYRLGMMYILNTAYTVYLGADGGKYTASGGQNMNQLYRKVEHDDAVHSMQLEILRELRTDEKKSIDTAKKIVDCLATFDGFIKSPDSLGQDWKTSVFPSF